MKQIIVTFDFEGKWGMPQPHDYDLAVTTRGLLDLLERAGAKAVFFVTGKLVNEYPDIMRAIHAHGHEIGIHGYKHEAMHNLSEAEIQKLGEQLTDVCKAVEHVTGYHPRGFRAPYLMGPVFYDPRVYTLLANLGFTWVSNREIRMPEELFRPDRLPFAKGLTRLPFARRMMLLALNARLIRTERPAGNSAWSTARWLTTNPKPYLRPEGLTEYPLTSPLDCDLLGMPAPATKSPDAFIAYTKNVLRECYNLCGDVFTINGHDWITGTSNRPQILEDTLQHLNATDLVRYTRPGLDDDSPANVAVAQQ